MSIIGNLEGESPKPGMPEQPAAHEPAEMLRRNGRWNYGALIIEGGFFGGGCAFVYPNTVLPTMIQSLGGPAWLISLMPVMMWLGLLIPPILTAHWIDRLHRYMPLLLTTGVFQRLPFLLAAVVLLYGGDPILMLWAVALAQLLSGIAGGVSLTAWQALVAKCVTDQRRSSMFAIRFASTCVIGLAAGYAVKAILQHWPGATGYGLLHLAAFTTLVVSYIIFALIREPRLAPPEHEHLSLWENLAAMPGLVLSDRPFSLYLVSRFFRNGIFIATPFLAIYAQQTLGRPESYVGQLLVAQMIGAVAGNLLAGYVGDKIGGKLVSQAGLAIFAGISAWAAVAKTNVEFQLIFLLFGFAFFAAEVGAFTLMLEICPARKRATYLSLASLVNLPGMLLASGISTMLWTPGSGFTGLAVATVIALLLSIAFLAPLHEPRGRVVRCDPAK